VQVLTILHLAMFIHVCLLKAISFLNHQHYQTYSWTNGATTSSVSNLAPGTYSVDITDANGCPLTETVVIQSVDCSSFAVSISKTNESYYQTNDGTANVNVTGGASPYTYNWSNGATMKAITKLMMESLQLQLQEV